MGEFENIKVLSQSRIPFIVDEISLGEMHRYNLGNGGYILSYSSPQTLELRHFDHSDTVSIEQFQETFSVFSINNLANVGVISPDHFISLPISDRGRAIQYEKLRNVSWELSIHPMDEIYMQEFTFDERGKIIDALQKNLNSNPLYTFQSDQEAIFKFIRSLSNPVKKSIPEDAVNRLLTLGKRFSSLDIEIPLPTESADKEALRKTIYEAKKQYIRSQGTVDKIENLLSVYDIDWPNYVALVSHENIIISNECERVKRLVNFIEELKDGRNPILGAYQANVANTFEWVKADGTVVEKNITRCHIIVEGVSCLVGSNWQEGTQVKKDTIVTDLSRLRWFAAQVDALSNIVDGFGNRNY